MKSSTLDRAREVAKEEGLKVEDEGPIRFEGFGRTYRVEGRGGGLLGVHAREVENGASRGSYRSMTLDSFRGFVRNFVEGGE